MTNFDVFVKNRQPDEGRKEKRPILFTRTHSVPKQVSDSSQSIGINEKTRRDGQLSGVILPSQIANDRWLSVYDAVLDSFLIFFAFLMFSYFEITVIGIGILAVMMAYMFFHIFWWENSMQWYFIETIRDYIDKTRRYYYMVFIVSNIVFATLGYYATYKYDFKEMAFKPVEYFYKTKDLITENTGIVDRLTSKSKKISKNDVLDNGLSEFSNERTYGVKTSTLEDDGFVKVEENTDSEEAIGDANEDKKNRLFLKDPSLTQEDILNFYLFYLIAAIYLFASYKYSSNYYKKIREKNIKGADSELKTNLEIKMEELKGI